MKILFYRYGSICEPDIISGFLELGNDVSEITVEISKKDFSPKEGIHLLEKELLAHSYDFVFSVNFYPFISEVCNIFQIRYICWTVDCPVMELYSDSILNQWNRIFLFDAEQYAVFSPRNPSCIFYLPLASNPKRWHSVICHTSVSEQKRYTADLSFVGSLYTEKCPYDKLQNASAYLTGYLDGIMDVQQRIYGFHFLEELLTDEVVDEFSSHLPGFYIPPEKSIRDDRTAMVQMYLEPKISAKERTQILNLLGQKYCVHVYTRSNTDGIPVKNCGPVKTLTEMPLVFHFSRINLNITSKSIHSGLPLRIFDVLACGGFLITNYQPELPDYFTPGTDLEYYSDEDDLINKVDFYLSHEKDRKEIAYNGLQKVIRYHNYPERLLQILSLAYDLDKKGDI